VTIDITLFSRSNQAAVIVEAQMKDTTRISKDKSAPQNQSRNSNRKHAGKGVGDLTIPGGAGAAGQIPIQGDNLKRKDDPLKPDVVDEADH
jgi:hypothetical protein